MPQDGLFFRVLRRFNIVWVALLGLVLIIGGGHDLYKSRGGYVKDIFSGGSPGRPGPYEPSPLKFETLEVRDAQRFPGPGTESAPEPWIYTFGHVTVPQGSPVGPDDKIDTSNLMVIDANGTGHWLFADNKRLIIGRDAVRKGVPAANTVADYDMRPIVGLVIMAQESPSPFAPNSVYVWKPNADKAVKLLAANHVLSYGQIGEDRYRVVYFDGKNERIALYALPEFDVVYDKALPKPPQ